MRAQKQLPTDGQGRCAEEQATAMNVYHVKLPEVLNGMLVLWGSISVGFNQCEKRVQRNTNEPGRQNAQGFNSNKRCCPA